MKRRMPIRDLQPCRELTETIIGDPFGLSWVVILPGLWGADEVVDQLETSTAVLRLDGALTDETSAGAIMADLPTSSVDQDLESSGGTLGSDMESVLTRWLREQQRTPIENGLPLIVLESPDLLSHASATILRDLTIAGTARLVAVISAEDRIPEFLSQLRRTGRLQVLAQTSMTARELDGALRRRLAAPVSATVLHRMKVLCGGHAVLAERVLLAAQSSGVLHHDDGLWMWGVEESRFRKELAALGSEILGGFGTRERELLILTAFVERIPEPWAKDHYGESVVHHLRSQRILSVDASSPWGFLDLRITAEALHLMVLSDMRRVDEMRLWYSVGRSIPPDAGGDPSRAALIWWRARIEGVLSDDDAQTAVTLGTSLRWYPLVIDVVERANPAGPALWVSAARAHYALGQTRTALTILKTKISKSRNGHSLGIHQSEVTDRAAMRSAVLVAERIALFHPELAGPVVEELRAGNPTSLIPSFDRVLHRPENLDARAEAEMHQDMRGVTNFEESATAQLLLGAQLGLRRNPDLGRLILSMLLDDLGREGGWPDIEESAVALLLLMTTFHGWRTNVARVNNQIWHGGKAQGPALAAVADVTHAVIAVRQDRMSTAFRYASSATRTFEIVDPFGLLPLASAVAAAAASYVDEELSRAAHEAHWQRSNAQEKGKGLRSIRITSAAIATVGSGLPPDEVSDRLVALAEQAIGQGEWVQHQQILLLALLGRSAKAAHAVLVAPWLEDSGQARMVGMLARALTTESAEEALDVADLLFEADAAFFALTILSTRWQQFNKLTRGARARIVRSVVVARHRAGEPSWLLSTFSDLTLDKREQSVLQALHEGSSTRAIAAQLHVSPRTVETAISGLLRRFSCANRVELLALDLLQD